MLEPYILMSTLRNQNPKIDNITSLEYETYQTRKHEDK